MKEKRFELSELGGYIVDNLTGKCYPCTGKHVVALLNQESDRADKVVEECDSIFKKHEYLIYNKELECMLHDMQEIAAENIEENIKYRKVMNKYGIDSVEKLDLILFWQQVW